MRESLSISKKIEVVRDVKKRSFGYSAVTIIVVAILLIGAVQPTLSTITKIVREIEEKELINTQLNTKIDALSNLGKEYNNGVKDQMKDISLIFPSRGDFSLLMTNVDEICKRNGFILNSINFDKPDSELIQNLKGGYNVLSPWKISLNVRGNKDTIVKLMTDFESLPNYPTITQLGFSNTVDASGLTSFAVEMLIFKVERSDFYASEN